LAQKETLRKVSAQKTAKATYDTAAAIKPTYTKTRCDPVKGIITKIYVKADGCDEEPTQEHTTKWGDCIKDTGSGYFIKVTGANALKAASVAMIAFIGSQF
jgi:hypothetical protein